MIRVTKASQESRWRGPRTAAIGWTAAGSGARFMGLVQRTDAAREWAYDRNSSIGRLDKGFDQAKAKGWTVVDMKRDWKVIYPFEKK